MECVKNELCYKVCEKQKGGIPAIIVAAGNSSRMNGINKQFLSLAGIPVIVRTLKVFENSAAVSRIILVTKKDNVLDLQTLCAKYMISKVSDIVEGGADRHASVLCGMERLAPDENKVLISDGARPFVTDNMISDCADALYRFPGSLCAIPASDTVKFSEGETVSHTLDRSKLYLAQTPQGVDVAIYKKASAEFSGADFTDDASVLEKAGEKVVIVPGSRFNIKITTPDDIPLAEALINGGKVL